MHALQLPGRDPGRGGAQDTANRLRGAVPVHSDRATGPCDADTSRGSSELGDGKEDIGGLGDNDE